MKPLMMMRGRAKVGSFFHKAPNGNRLVKAMGNFINGGSIATNTVTNNGIPVTNGGVPVTYTP